eukprot:jgi/Tetstr1/433190/TSEL_002373.t1
MRQNLAEGLFPAYDQPQPGEAAVDQPAATQADSLARAGVSAWAEYEADLHAEDVVICPPNRTLLALLEVGEVWKARRSADSDEEFADTLRLAMALTTPVALLRAVHLRTIVIYHTEPELDFSELLIHPFSQMVREAGELGGNTGQNQLRRTTIGMRKKARKTPPASLALRAEQRPVYTLTLQLDAHHDHIIIGSTRATEST